jgi:NAD-dependent SIR2 family protein deacetylase
LFLAGAGVSVPSGLPQFEELALRIYDSIGETMRPTLQKVKKHTSPSKREQIFDAASLSADKRAEADLFLDKQFDRFFSALESGKNSKRPKWS